MAPDYKYTGVDDANEIIQEQILMPSTLETIDTAMFKYLNESFNFQANTNEGFKKSLSYGSRLNGHTRLRIIQRLEMTRKI